MLILVLLLFIVGPKYLDPPEEYGVAVNFGTTDFGRETLQPKNLLNRAKGVNEPPSEESQLTTQNYN